MMIPDKAYVLEHRGDIEDFIVGTKIIPGDPLATPPTDDTTVDKTIDDFVQYAFKEIKRDLRNKRKLDFEQLYKGTVEDGAYFDEFTEQQILDCISWKAISQVFYEYAVDPSTTGQWMNWGHEFRDKYEHLLRDATFQVWGLAPRIPVSVGSFLGL
jgi:hypothetical protein